MPKDGNEENTSPQEGGTSHLSSPEKTNPALWKEKLLMFPAMKIKNARKIATFRTSDFHLDNA
jgi:hypothetical protein